MYKTESFLQQSLQVNGKLVTRGGILSIRCGEILLISSSTVPGLGRVSAKNDNKLTDFNASPDGNRLLTLCDFS